MNPGAKCVCQLPQADGASSLAPWDFKKIPLWVTFGGNVVWRLPLPNEVIQRDCVGALLKITRYGVLYFLSGGPDIVRSSAQGVGHHIA